MKTGLLIVNIGTPESPTTTDVGRYLKKFLMDEDVISLPFLFRWILVHLLIVPFRAVKSAAKYAKIWTPEGSPLKVNTDQFSQLLQEKLGANYTVKIGMAFSEPSIHTSLKQFENENVDQIIICPMFPQYAEATTGAVLKAAKKISQHPQLFALKPFYHQDFYIDNVVKKCGKPSVDHWIFSYHGLPEKQVTKTPGCQLRSTCCFSQNTCTINCYRSHCFKTTQALARKLQLKPSDFTITFQSRLGIKKWLQPYTDEVLKQLPSQNKKSIAVVSPAFVADCLETLEEINIESRNLFIENGGEKFEYIPCLNADEDWVSGFAKYVTEKESISRLN